MIRRTNTVGHRWAWSILLAWACSAELPAPPAFEDVDDEVDPASTRIGPVPLRRLTREQYVRTVADLFGDALPDDLGLVDALPVDDVDGGFAANSVGVSETVVAQYEEVAERIALAVAPARAQLHPCLAAAVPAPSCNGAFLAAFAPRALRRGVTADELAELESLMATATDAAASTPEAADLAVRRVLAAVLQSPDFLYRIERGVNDLDDPDSVRLQGHEIAARMSYLLWGTMPDDALAAEAEAGRLRDPGYRATVVDRMLLDPRAATGLAAMHRQWLGLGALDHLVKDRNVFPTFSEALGVELDQEFADFVDHAIRHHDGTLTTLLTSNQTVASAAVVSWYGDDVVDVVDAVDASAGFGPGRVLVTLDPTRRAGALTLLSVLAAHAKPDRSDPVRRGALVLGRLLCEPLAAPPPGAATPPAAPAPGASERERLEVHTADAACAPCHAQIDPLGFALEGYDAMGRFRTHDDAGNPIDASASVGGRDIDGGVELARALAEREDVEACYATQWFRQGFGRLEDDDDDAFLLELQQGFADSGGHIPSLLRQMIGSDAFVHRRRR